MRPIRRLPIVCLAMGALLGGCSSDSPTGPNVQPAALSAVLAEMATTAAVRVRTTAAGSIPAASPWPASGSLAIDESGTTGGLTVPPTHMLMVFHGSSIVDFSITTAGLTASCRMDLSGKGGPTCPGLF